MRLAVERQKAASVQADAPPPSSSSSPAAASAPRDDVKVPDFKVPDMPSFSMPKLDMPKFDVPAPPKFDVPAPAPPNPAASSSSSVVPEFKVPDALPKFEMPKVDAPLFSMPKFDVPAVPKFDMPAVPKFDMPAVPKFDMPAAPPAAYNLDVPKFDMPTKSSSSPKAVVDENLEPQEVRDARAADKNAAFKAAKDEAKVGFCPCPYLSAIFRYFYRLPPMLPGGGVAKFRRCNASDWDRLTDPRLAIPRSFRYTATGCREGREDRGGEGAGGEEGFQGCQGRGVRDQTRWKAVSLDVFPLVALPLSIPSEFSIIIRAGSTHSLCLRGFGIGY